MVRFLLTVFFVGLVVAGGSWAAVLALGGPDDSWVSIGDDHGRWSLDDRDDETYTGQVITRDIAWTPSDSLEISVPAEITYTQGPTAKITATGPDVIVKNLAMEDDRIKVLHRHRSRNLKGLTLVISAPNVQRFELNGAAKMTIQNYAQNELTLKLNGASKLDVIGTAKQLDLKMNGASQSDLRRLVNDTADVEINGAGQAILATTGHADIEINGVGNAQLVNTPSLSRHIHGIGSIETGVGGDGATAAPATPAAPVAPQAPAKPAVKTPRVKAEPA